MLPNGETLHVFGIVALHQDEMDQKLASGVESLFEGFRAAGVSELLDASRRSSLTPP